MKNDLKLTIKVCIKAIFEECTRAKVNELDLVASHVDKNVLILDVSVNNTGTMNVHGGCHQLDEEIACLLLRQGALLRDVVEQILHRLWTLEDENEAVGLLIVAKKLDDTLDVAHFLEQTDLHWHYMTIQLQHTKRYQTYTNLLGLLTYTAN